MQTSVDLYLVKGMEGQKADTNFDDVLSRFASTDVPFGKGLVEGVGAGNSELPSASGQIFDGVALHTHSSSATLAGVRLYIAGEAISLLRRGRVWVKSEDVITINSIASLTSPVYLRHTANGAGKIPGNFLTTADSSKATALTNCKWLTETTVVNDIALLEIR